MDFFKKPEVVVKEVYKIVELAIPRSLQSVDSNLRESILTLQAHPGFVYLLNKLAYQNAALRTKLCGERHSSIDDVAFLQAGVYWSNWLANELKMATAKVAERQLDPMAEELKAFQALDSQLERVGM